MDDICDFDFDFPAPEQQINFGLVLEGLRNDYLIDALYETIKGLDVGEVDKQLRMFVPNSRLAELAGRGLRGEIVYAVPYVLERNPRLLAYYRLLLGYSQKEFYDRTPGVSVLKTMETYGTIGDRQRELLPSLCRGLVKNATFLVDGLAVERISASVLDDLTILTVGPQLRGGYNVARGIKATKAVFDAIHDIVEGSIKKESISRLDLLNAAGRVVVIAFGADPDVTIKEEMAPGTFRNLIAIEVKGGKDVSNIHNRIGEAEKSHQKAKNRGFTEFWTVVNVGKLELTMAREESPTTNQFYSLGDLESKQGDAYEDFKNRITGITGIH